MTLIKDVRDQGLDKFYTNLDIAERCIERTNEKVILDSFDIVVEPSAGGGSFSHQLHHDNVIAMDISPEKDDKNITQQDFLTYYPIKKPSSKIITIGNPPFGKNSSLAIKFFNHAAKWSDVIAFIIPKVFRRISIQNKLCTYFHLIHDEDIPTTPCSFSPPMNVKCCFQIWKINKEGVKRDIIRLPTIHSHWNFLGFGPKDENNQPTPPEGADFAIRAYGGKCGDIVENTEDLKNLRPKSWHWIQCIPSNVEKKALIERFYSLNYSNSKNTARQNSIGKGELIALYSDVYDAKW